MFFFTGAIFGSWASRVPAVKEHLNLTEGHLAIAFVALHAGAIIGLQTATALTIRMGSRSALKFALPAFALGLPGLASVNGVLMLCVVLTWFGVVNSLADVAMNRQAMEIQERTGRRVLSRFHAMHSLGMIAGAVGGSVASALAVSLLVHFVVTAMIAAPAGLAATYPLLPARAPATGARGDSTGWGLPLQHWSRPVLVIGTLGFCVTVAEGSVNDWAAVYLHGSTGVSEPVAALGFGAFGVALLVGRLAGDHVVGLLGPVRAFRFGTLTAGLGFGVSLLVPHPLIAFAGIVALGLGISYTLPLALSTAVAAPDEATAVAAVAQISTLSHLGAFAGPALIGPIATTSSLGTALLAPALIVALASFGAGSLRPRHLPPIRLN